MEELQRAEEVGPKVAESIFQFFREPRNQELVERLRAAGLQFEYAVQRRKGGPLPGLTFVLTGTLPNLSREEAKRLIEAAGGKVSGVGQQARPATWWRARMPARSWIRRVVWGCR